MKHQLLFIVTFFLVSFSVFAQDLNMQNGTFNQCSGVFYDSGGNTGNYSNNENIIMTICPDAGGDFIQLTFTQFSTQLNADVLTIYDGADTTAPVIGSFDGGGPGNNPGVITASQSNVSGCLTIEFISDGNYPGPGWSADILCGAACQNIVASIDSTIPAAVNNIIEIFPGQTVDFTGSATFSDSGAGATYLWDFGEGTPQNGQNVSHTYNTSGVYIVNFTVSDSNPTGCSGTQTIEVHVLSDHVTVDGDLYTELELVEDVLINSGCASIDNLTFQGGPNTQGIAYFNRSGSTFPFQEGIILMSGDAEQAAGPETGTLSTGGWGTSDPDLEAAIPGLNSLDATWMEFEFTPLANEISFNFIFASEEYGTFQCSFADGFAFLLTEVATGITTNLAVVPGTTNPVSVLTIRDNAYNSGCASVNPQYFGAYYDDFDGLPEATAPINIKGHTVPLTASGTVVPNTLYSIKLVIADHNDTLWDSAVFLEGGSFNLGGDLGEDITIAASNTVCEGDSIVLDTGIVGADGNHIWYYNGNIITGENNSTITVTQSGTYSVDVVLSADCQTSDDILIEFYPNPIVESINNLFLCNPGAPPFIFDLTQNTPLAIGSQPNASDFVVTYHNSQADADADTGAIGTTGTYSGVDGEIIYLRIDYPNSNCYETSSFTLNITPEPTINAVGDLVQCDDSSNDGVADFDLESQTLTILGAQPSSDFTVTYYSSQASADAGTGALSSPYSSSGEPIWVRVELASDASCSNVSVGPFFDLVLNPVPEIIPASQTICDNVLPGDDGFGEFDLTLSETSILNGLPSTDYTITYYEDATDAETGPGSASEILTPGAYTNTTATTQTVHVRVENITTQCYSVAQLLLTVDPLPVITGLATNTDICDGTDAIFTITGMPGDVVDYNINGGASSQITLDASGEGIVTVPGATVNQTITLEQITNPDTSCSSTLTDTATVTVVALPSIVSLTTNTDICSGEDAIFTITGTPGDVVDYNINGGASTQVTLDALGEGIVTVAGATVDQVVTLEQVTNPTSNCSSPLTDTATVIVNPNPTANVVAAGDICPNGDAVFTITGDAGDIVDYNVNGGASVQVTLDALGEWVVTIPSVGVTQTLSLENVENPTTACSSTLTTTAVVVVNPLPTVVDPSPLIVCDDNVADGMTEMDLNEKNDEISGGNATYIVTYHASLLDAENGSPEVLPSSSAYIGTDGEVVWVRVEDAATGCYATTTLELGVVDAPAVPSPSALHYCDPDNDGLGVFDLTDTRNNIEAIDPTYEVSFHLTEQNAMDDVLPQPDVFTNVAGQIIYIRVDYGPGTNCPTILELELIIDPTPDIEMDPEALVLCDDDGVADGMTQFDLTTSNTEILNGLDPMAYSVTYYTTQAGAEIGTTDPSYIATPGAFTNTVASNQTVWVRVENNATGCIRVTSLELIVNPLPVPVTTTEAMQYEICDDSVDNDGYAIFDLTVQDNIITGGNSSWSVAYYETMADVTANTPIADYTAYANTSIGGAPHNPQTIFVTVSSTANGVDCYALTTLTLVVNTVPTPTAALPNMELCDDNNPGDLEEEFDITANEAAMLNAYNETVSYHTTMADAESGANSIPNPTAYTNTGPTQTIYARVTNTGDPSDPLDTGTGCYTIVSFDIIVNPLPDTVAVDNIIACELNTDNIYIFDLTTQTSAILNGQPEPDFAVSYYTTLAAAESGTGAIANPSAFQNTVNPQEIFVNINNTITSCDIATVSFFVEVQEAAEVNPNHDTYVLCDDTMEFDGDPSNDSVGFDLLSQNFVLLNGQDPANFNVTYYETMADAEAMSNAIGTSAPYVNLTNPQVIWVRIDNDSTPGSICYDIKPLTLQVDPIPAFDMDDLYTICINTNGTEVISAPLMDTGLSSTLYGFEWTEAGDPSTVLSTGSFYEPPVEGTYTVMVTDLSNGCTSTDTAVVQLSSPPNVTANVTTEAFADNHIIEVTATGDGAAVFEFSIDNGPWVSNEPNTNTYTFSNVPFGEHVIQARDINGCGVASDMVLVMDYPLFFTPNNDGYNDTWRIFGIENQLDAKIFIYDRYGKLLKQLSPTGPGWDGTYNGELMPSSDYWFTIEYRELGESTGEQKQFKAHFSLKR